MNVHKNLKRLYNWLKTVCRVFAWPVLYKHLMQMYRVKSLVPYFSQITWLGLFVTSANGILNSLVHYNTTELLVLQFWKGKVTHHDWWNKIEPEIHSRFGLLSCDGQIDWGWKRIIWTVKKGWFKVTITVFFALRLSTRLCRRNFMFH